MAWVYDDKKNELYDDTNGVIDLSGAAGSPTGTTPTSGVSVGSSPSPTSSGQFTDINKYLSLNQPKTEALGQKVAGGVENTVNTVESGLSGAQNEFNQQIGQAGPQIAQDQYNKLVNPMDLVEFTKNPDNVSKFQSDFAGTYQGPSSFQDINNYDDLFDSLDKANKVKDQFETSGGRQELIKDVYTDPSRAKAGMLGLDEALLNQTPSAYAPVKTQVDRTQDLQDRFDQISQSSSQQIQDTQKALAERSKDIQSKFLGEGGIYGTLQSNIDKRVQDVSSQGERAAAEAKNWLDPNWLRANNKITSNTLGNMIVKQQEVPKEALEQMGITQTQYANLVNRYLEPKYFQEKIDQTPHEGSALDPDWYNQAGNWGEYVTYGTPTTGNISRDTVATADEYAQLAALEQLMGDQINENFITTPDKAGSYSNDFVDFDYDRLLEYLKDPRYLRPVVSSAGPI